MDKEQAKNIQLRVSPQQQALFANSVNVHVSDDNVVLQYVYVRPQTSDGVLVAEVALSPKHAIQFQQALSATLKRHFTRHLEEMEGKGDAPAAPGEAPRP